MFEKSEQRKKDIIEQIQGKAMDDILMELEAEGVMVSEQDIIEEEVWIDEIDMYEPFEGTDMS